MKLTEFLEELDKPVVYYPKLAIFIGSVKATIFLSQLIYWKGKESDKDGWIYKTRKQITEETGLSRYEQEKARKDLISLGFLKEKYAGVPRRLYFLVDKDKLNEEWNRWVSQQVENQPARRRKTNQQEGGKTTNKQAKNQPTITENTQEITTEITTDNSDSTESHNWKASSMIIDAFSWNPVHKSWYGKNKTQRNATFELMKLKSVDELVNFIKFLPELNKQPYFPTTTTPYQLLQNWEKIKAYFAKNNNKKQSGNRFTFAI